MTRRIPIFSTIVVAAAIATMIALGVWQLGRMDEKEAMIARYEAALSSGDVLETFPQDAPTEYLYRQTSYTCGEVVSWNAIAGRNANDQPGYIHIARCAASGTAEGAEIVAGWSRDPQARDWAGGEVAGMIAPGGEQGWRILADTPIDGLQANAAPDPADLPNNHLAYAGQWFFFAITALVIYVLALRRRSAAEIIGE